MAIPLKQRAKGSVQASRQLPPTPDSKLQTLNSKLQTPQVYPGKQAASPCPATPVARERGPRGEGQRSAANSLSHLTRTPAFRGIMERANQSQSLAMRQTGGLRGIFVRSPGSQERRRRAPLAGEVGWGVSARGRHPALCGPQPRPGLRERLTRLLHGEDEPRTTPSPLSTMAGPVAISW